MTEKPKAIIVDIDGTLADCEHRRHFVESKPKDWDSFYLAAVHDPLRKNVAKVVNSFLYLGHEIIYVTGRPERLRGTTRSWLNYHKLPLATKLYMRPDEDFSDDAGMKLKIYREKIEPKFDVQLVIDDRTRVVEMWREIGLECWQVAAGDF